jgi:phage terminase large subunit-like protein
MNKSEVIAKIPEYLEILDSRASITDSVDSRLTSYVYHVLENPDLHAKYEILGVFRFINFLGKYELKTKKIKKYIAFYESLKFPSAKGMQSFKLTPIQVFQFTNILGFYSGNSRICREALLFVPRKYSKTTSVGSLAIFDLLFGDSDAQAYVASNSFSQSKICFDIIKNSLKELDPGFQNFRLNRDIIYTKIPGRTSFIRCLASSADKLYGLNASMVILDEYSQAESAALKNVLTSSMGVRKNPLVVTITTASTKLDTPFTAMLNNYKKILEGELENDSIFASIFEPDEDDDPGDELTWQKVQPHLGITVSKEFYKAEFQKTLISADDKTEFMCKLLNVFSVPLDKVWIDPHIIERNLGEFDLTKLAARPQCMVSVDLSVKDDFSCVCYALYDSINKRFVFKNEYYIPKNTVENHHNSEMYKNLVNSGHLKICGTDVIDYNQISNDIIANSRYVNILQLGYDSYKSRELINILRAAGLKSCVPYSQTYANFTSPIESFEAAVYQDRLKFDSNPLNLYCIKNCIIDEDRMCNKKPIKKTHNLKIDGAICILMCLGMFNNYKR